MADASAWDRARKGKAEIRRPALQRRECPGARRYRILDTITAAERNTRRPSACRIGRPHEAPPPKLAQLQRCGAPGGSRTPDQLLRRQLLYPLSYEGVGAHYSLQGIGRVGPASTRVCVQGRRIRAHLGTLARDSPRPPLARASPTSRMRPLFGRTRPGFRRRNPFRLPPGPDRRLVSIATRRPKDSVVRGRCADSRRSLSPGGTFVPCQHAHAEYAHACV